MTRDWDRVKWSSKDKEGGYVLCVWSTDKSPRGRSGYLLKYCSSLDRGNGCGETEVQRESWLTMEFVWTF